MNEEVDQPVPMSAGKKLAFALLTVVVILLLPELFCRMMGLGPSGEVAAYFAEWQHGPGGEPFWVLRGAGHNREGMRDRDHAVENTSGLPRIAFLGDSVTVGHGVQHHETYPLLFESFLRQIGLQAEVFNFSTPGWSTRQELIAYDRLVRKYKPDHVFLAFCLNDVAEMSNNMRARPSEWQSWLARNSAFARALAGAERQQVRRVEELFTQPISESVSLGWRLALADIITLRDKVRADGAEFSVIVFPFRFQLVDQARERAAQVTIFDFCFRNGIPCLDLLDALVPLGESALIDDSHLSPEGSSRVAEALIVWGRTGCMMCGLDISQVTEMKCPRCDAPIERKGNK
ncbi:MAG: SGNH/GDSL hydrolase family protein [Planctomycetota bacterium]|jgi:lysophospholipase L1-like esterase